VTLRRSKLAQLVIAYEQRFGGQVPARVLLLPDAAPVIQGALDTGVALAETDWDRTPPFQFSLRGCIVGRGAPKKLPNGDWLH
jgi:hypothetical protein